MAFAACLLCAQLRADTLQPGYIEFTQTDDTAWRMYWKPPLQTGQRFAIQPALPANCDTSTLQRDWVASGAAAEAWTVHCAPPLHGQEIGIEADGTGFAEVIARVRFLDAGVQTYRLTRDAPYARLDDGEQQGSVLFAYGGLGFEHILEGYDHILFVLCLVLLLRDNWAIVKAVTSFTLAHSITLALSTQGWIQLERALVEVLIALSIVVLAAEVVGRSRQAQGRQQTAVFAAFMFGLLHGMGFAGALAEIGLPEGEKLLALLGFNLGVEAGQLAIVAALLLIGTLAAKLFAAAINARLASAAASLSGIIGAYWMFERMLG